MASNPLRKSGRDINFLCGAATGEPVSLHTVLPSFNAIHTNIPERRNVSNPLPPWQPPDLSLPLRRRPPNRSPSSHHSPIQLPPFSNQRFSAPDMRRHRPDWGPNRNNTVADYAHDPFSAPDMRDQLSSSPSALPQGTTTATWAKAPATSTTTARRPAATAARLSR
ncbi:transcriptional repressor [Pseudogymnoascus australis]